MEKSLLYVSRSLVEPRYADLESARIVLASRPRNERLGLTGVLIATPDKFAQILEGQATSIDEVFESIRRDPRHKDVTVLSYEGIGRRLFDRWSLAYSGPSSYVVGHVEPLLSGRSSGGAAQADILRLTKLMYEFGRSPIRG